MMGLYGSLSKKRQRSRFHKRTANLVDKVYSNLVQNEGIVPLTPVEIKHIKEYAREVFGSPHYHHWLKIYATCRGEFKEGWIPDDFFGEITPKINNLYRSVSAAKTLNARLLGDGYFPDKAYFINGVWVDIEGTEVAVENLKEFLFQSHPRVFAKCELSSQGKGIIPLIEKDFDLKKLEKLGNLVVQAGIVQHDWCDQFSPECVATLRITTALPYGSLVPTWHAAYLRLGYGGSQFITSSRSLRVAILDNEGSLDDKAIDSAWRFHYVHPDTATSFAGHKMPSFAAAVTVCEKLHAKICQFTVIGWDVAIDSHGSVQIMEWNGGYPDIKLSEAVTGPCFADLGLERFALHS